MQCFTQTIPTYIPYVTPVSLRLFDQVFVSDAADVAGLPPPVHMVPGAGGHAPCAGAAGRIHGLCHLRPDRCARYIHASRQLKWTTTLTDSNNTAVSKPRSAGAAWGCTSEGGRDSLSHFALEIDDKLLMCPEPQLLLLHLNSFPCRRGAGLDSGARLPQPGALHHGDGVTTISKSCMQSSTL